MPLPERRPRARENDEGFSLLLMPDGINLSISFYLTESEFLPVF